MTTTRKAAAVLAVLAATLAGSIGTAEAAPAARTWNEANPCVAAIRAVWPRQYQERAIAISFRESRHTPGIANARSMGRAWGRATGCLQILPGVARRIGSTCDLRNAFCNASTGWRLWNYRGSRWRPWAVR